VYKGKKAAEEESSENWEWNDGESRRVYVDGALPRSSGKPGSKSRLWSGGLADLGWKRKLLWVLHLVV